MCYNGGVCDDKTGLCICPNNFRGQNCLNSKHEMSITYFVLFIRNVTFYATLVRTYELLS